MARPKKTADDRLESRQTVRYTTAEKVFLEDQAHQAGVGVAELIRRRSLGLAVQPRPGRVNAALVSELNRIGVNVNQLARAVHRGRDLPDYWRTVGRQLEDALVQLVLSINQDPKPASKT